MKKMADVKRGSRNRSEMAVKKKSTLKWQRRQLKRRLLKKTIFMKKDRFYWPGIVLF